MVHTRSYREGRLVARDFGLDELEAQRHDGATLWIDLTLQDTADLERLAPVLDLHPLAAEDLTEHGQRVKLDRYPGQMLVSVYVLRLEDRVTVHELKALVTRDVLLTVRVDESIDLEPVLRSWDAHPELVKHGVGGLLWGLLDVVVDSHLALAQDLDGQLDHVEEMVFADRYDQREAQRAAYRVYHEVSLVRRRTQPMRDVLGAVVRGADDDVLEAAGAEDLLSYFRDVDDHVLRLASWTDAMRDVATTLLDANLAVQSNRMNLVMKKVTSWAAIIALPTLVTGVYGMNVEYPSYGTAAGWWVGLALVLLPPALLFWLFRSKDWL